MPTLWTYHPGDFRVDDPQLKIDHRKGKNWNRKAGRRFRYRDVLPEFIDRLGTDQFLWCCTAPGQFVRTTEEIDLVEWTLTVPDSQVISYLHTDVWERLVWGERDDWPALRPDWIPPAESLADYGAIVRVPLSEECSAVRREMQPKYPAIRSGGDRSGAGSHRN